MMNMNNNNESHRPEEDFFARTEKIIIKHKERASMLIPVHAIPRICTDEEILKSISYELPRHELLLCNPDNET